MGSELLDVTQSLTRFRLGGSLEFILSDKWNVWASFEGILAGPDRRILGDMWGFERDDLSLYARLGLTYKFGYTEREDDYETVRRAQEPEADGPAELSAPPAE